MHDAGYRNNSPRRRPFGSGPGWAIVSLFTAGFLFMSSGAVGHAAVAPTSAVLAHAGWIMAGLSPLMAYIAFQLLVRRWGRPVWPVILLCLGLSVAAFILCMVIGACFLQIAYPEGPGFG